MFSLIPGLQVSIVGLERALHQYTLEPSETPFDLKTVPLATQPLLEHKTGESCIYLIAIYQILPSPSPLGLEMQFPQSLVMDFDLD